MTLMMSGHCAFPTTDSPVTSHDRCEVHGGGNTANPKKEFHPCPCSCHLGEEFECGNCGRALREAPLWPNTDPDCEPDEMVYTHVDPHTGRAIGEVCP